MKHECRTAWSLMFALALPLLLAACAASPPRPAPPAPPAPAVAESASIAAPAIVQPQPPAPGVTEVLLAYQQSLLQMRREDLQKESVRLAEQSSGSRTLLRRAMVLATLRGPGDLARAQQLAEQAVRSSDQEARAVRPLAQLLASTYGDLRRQTEQAERLTQQTREQQRRIDQLDHMIEGLKAIERNLATRPAAATPPAPGAPAK